MPGRKSTIVSCAYVCKNSFLLFLSTSFLSASRSYFSFSPLLSYPPWNFLIFYINYTKYIEMNSKLSLSLFSLPLEFQIPQVFKWNYISLIIFSKLFVSILFAYYKYSLFDFYIYIQPLWNISYIYNIKSGNNRIHF